MGSRRTARLACLITLAAAVSACSRLPPAEVEIAPTPSDSLPAKPSANSILSGGWDNKPYAFVIESHDALTGEATAWGSVTLQDAGRGIVTYAFSPDGKMLALATGATPYCIGTGIGSACWTSTKALDFVDVSTRAVVSVAPGFGRTSSLAFSPDGKRLALVHESRQAIELRLYDPSSGALLQSTSFPFFPDYLGYTRDGQGLILIGSANGPKPGFAPPGPLTAVLADSESLGIKWQQSLDGVTHGWWCLKGCDTPNEFSISAYWSPAIVRIPGTDRVAIVHADADKLTSIDASAQRVATMDITAPRSWLDRLMALGAVPAEAKGGMEGAMRQAVASADGSRLYVVSHAYHARMKEDGSIEYQDEPLGLQVLDPMTGSKIASIDTGASQVLLSQDGERLFLTAWEEVRIWTVALPVEDLRDARPIGAWNVLAGNSLEGEPLLVGTSAGDGPMKVAAIDPASLAVGQSWALTEGSTLLLR